MIKTGFFNSVNGDRTYNADDMSQYYSGLIHDGVLNGYENGLMVAEAEGMAVTVKTGKAYMEGKYFEISGESQAVNINQSDTITNRYTAILIQKDDIGRQCTLITRDGEGASGTPKYPEIKENEMCLAMIYVKKLAETITQADIIDMRGSEYCGWVTGVVEFLDTSTLFAQWTKVFETWYSNIQKEMEMEHRADIKIQADTKEVTIPETANYTAGDVMLVFKNGILLKKGEEYSVNTEGTKITTVSTIKAGNEINIVNIKPKLKETSL